MRGMMLRRVGLVMAAAMAALASDMARCDIVVLKANGSEASHSQAIKQYSAATGGWTIYLQSLYAPGGLTIYEIRCNGGEIIDRIVINVPCWQAPSGDCMPAGSPVFVRVFSDPPFGVKAIHAIEQTGTAETLLTEVYVEQDIGSVEVETVGKLVAGRDIVGPVVATTAGNPMRGIGHVEAGRFILGDLLAPNGLVGVVRAGQAIGTPASPIEIRFNFNVMDLVASVVHAHINARANGGNGSLWRLEAQHFAGSIEMPELGYRGGDPGLVAITDSFSGVLRIGSSFDDPAHLIQLPVGGMAGQVIINADNSGGVWSAPIHIGPEDHPDHVSLIGPTYEASSEMLGGGAIGIVPYRLHPTSSHPASDSMIVLAEGDEPVVVTLEHYGPLLWSGGDPVLIEKRAIDSDEFVPVSLDEFAILMHGTRSLRIASSEGEGEGFTPGFEYRITPTPALRSEAAGYPPVVWSAPYTIVVTSENDDRGDAEPATCLGDLNCDWVVDVFDLLILLAEWGTCGGGPDQPTTLECPADLDGNMKVDVFDLLILLAHWGPCATGGGVISG